MRNNDFKSMARFLKENKAFSAFIKNRKNYIDRYSSFFVNYDRTKVNYNFSETSFSSALVSFSWRLTPEGDDFWRNLCNSIRIYKNATTYKYIKKH